MSRAQRRLTALENAYRQRELEEMVTRAAADAGVTEGELWAELDRLGTLWERAGSHEIWLQLIAEDFGLTVAEVEAEMADLAAGGS